MNTQDYEQKKRECWEEYWKPRKAHRHGDAAEMVHYDAFSYAFDRAFTLGKQEITQGEIEKASVEYADKTAKQYEVCNSEFVQEIMVAFEQGVNFALGKQEKDAEDSVIQGWVAVDDDGGLFLYRTKPARDEVSGMWMSNECPLDVGIKLFPDLTWESDPEPVEIIIKRKKK